MDGSPTIESSQRLRTPRQAAFRTRNLGDLNPPRQFDYQLGCFPPVQADRHFASSHGCQPTRSAHGPWRRLQRNLSSMADSGIITLSFPDPDIARAHARRSPQGSQRAIEHRAGGTRPSSGRAGKTKRSGRPDHPFAASPARSSPVPTCASSPPRTTCPSSKSSRCAIGGKSSSPGCRGCRPLPWPRSTASASAAGPNWRSGAIGGS